MINRSSLNPFSVGKRWLPIAFVLCLTLVMPIQGQVTSGGGGFHQGKGAHDSDAFLFHTLNRLTYGPTEASFEQIKTMGVDAWIERQLRPELIDDTIFEAQLANDVPDSLDPLYAWDEFMYQHIFRAVSSERQLQEIMTQFWENHFDTVVPRGNNEVEQHEWTELEDWENRLFRANGFGNFRDLLEISAKSQAMMYFLDNYRNNVASGNENYARELLELHTLGVDCGYAQWDVEQVARIWTGWNGCYIVRDCSDPRLHTEDIDGDGRTDFVFNQDAHDFFPKDTLGTTFQTEPGETGFEEGERVLDLLVAHPCTARFISRKLLEVFVDDKPSDELVDRVATTFRNTNGEIRDTLRTIFDSPEFRNPSAFNNKVKTPFEFTVSAVRALEGVAQVDPGRVDASYRELRARIIEQGMDIFNFAVPTGFAERAPAWISANGFLQRWKFSDRLAYSLRDQNYAVFSDPMGALNRLEIQTADAVIVHYSKMLLGQDVDGVRHAMLRTTLIGTNASGEYEPGTGSQENQLRQMISHMLGYPEFNKQ